VNLALPTRPVIRDRQREHCFTACPVRAVGELQHAAVGLCDLAAQDKTAAAAAVLGGEEWNKQIVTVEQAAALSARTKRDDVPAPERRLFIVVISAVCLQLEVATAHSAVVCCWMAAFPVVVRWGRPTVAVHPPPPPITAHPVGIGVGEGWKDGGGAFVAQFAGGSSSLSHCGT
jgi:hypothetical protein